MQKREIWNSVKDHLAFEEIKDSLESIKQLTSREWHDKNNSFLRRALRTGRILIQESFISMCEIPPIIIHRSPLRRLRPN